MNKLVIYSALPALMNQFSISLFFCDKFSTVPFCLSTQKELFNWQTQRSLEVSLISANFFFRLCCGNRRRCQSRLQNLFRESEDLFLWITGGSVRIRHRQLLGQECVFSSEIAVQKVPVHQQQIRYISLFLKGEGKRDVGELLWSTLLGSNSV